MSEKTVNTTIEILGKIYPVRCLESETESLQKSAKYLNDQMAEIQDSGKVINLERIAIITALNMTHQLLQTKQQKRSLVDEINDRIASLQDKLDTAFNKTLQTEFVYSAD